MKKSIKRSILFIIVACLTRPVYGQLPVFDEKEIMAFAGEAKAVVLDRKEVVTIAFSKGKPMIEVSHTDHIMYLSESSMAGQQFEIPFSDKFFPLKSISGYTYVKGEKGYTKIKAKPPVYTSKVADGLFYDDMKQATLTLPSIEKYAVSELNYTYQILDPLFVFPYYFKPADAFPLVSSVFRIEYDPGFEIRLLMFGDSSAVTTESGMKGKVKWIEKKMEKQSAKKSFENTPASAYYKAHLYYLITAYNEKSNRIDYLGTNEQLYKQNYQYIKDFNEEACSKELKTVTDSIKKASVDTDSLQLIENILYWIQDHIRYIAIEDGLSGYVPRPSNAVFDRRYGDCKDMASLMQYMLKACGIESNLAWIGTRDIPYTYSQLPIIQNSNHMILAKKINNEWHFFDPTAEGLKSFLPSSFIQGKEAMIAIDENNFEIAKVPEIEHHLNFITDTISGKLSKNGDMELSGKMSFGGLARWRIVAMYKSYDEENRKKFIETLIKHEYDKAKVIEFEMSNLNERNRPFEISFKAEFPDYAKVIDDKYYFNPNLRKSIMNEKIKDDRVGIPVEYMFKYLDVLKFNIELPENTRATSFPSRVDYTSELIDFNYEINDKSGLISVNSSVGLKSLFFQDSEFEVWNQGIKEINKSFRESLVVSPSK